MINGKNWSWEDIDISLPSGPLVLVESIDYGDKKDLEPVYGKGDMPQGFGGGNYSAEGKLTIKKEEMKLLDRYLLTLGLFRIYDLPPFPITVSYANEDQGSTTDVLNQCKFVERSTAPKQNDKGINVDLTFQILGGIVWGV
jgi:hypothetical protein